MAHRITTLAAPSPAIRLIGGDDESDESVESDWLVDVRVGVDVDVAVLDIDVDVDHVETDHPETVGDADVDTHAGPVEAGLGLAVRAQSPSLPQASNLPSQHHFHSREGELVGTPTHAQVGGWLTLASTCSARTYGLALGRDVAVCLRWSPALTDLGKRKSVRYLHRRP